MSVTGTSAGAAMAGAACCTHIMHMLMATLLGPSLLTLSLLHTIYVAWFISACSLPSTQTCRWSVCEQAACSTRATFTLMHPAMSMYIRRRAC